MPLGKHQILTVALICRASKLPDKPGAVIIYRKLRYQNQHFIPFRKSLLRKIEQIRQEKERLYKEALAKHQAIIKALKDEAEADKERLDYLQSLNILLARAIDDLKADLGVA